MATDGAIEPRPIANPSMIVGRDEVVNGLKVCMEILLP